MRVVPVILAAMLVVVIAPWVIMIADVLDLTKRVSGFSTSSFRTSGFYTVFIVVWWIAMAVLAVAALRAYLWAHPRVTMTIAMVTRYTVGAFLVILTLINDDLGVLIAFLVAATFAAFYVDPPQPFHPTGPTKPDATPDRH